MLYKKIEHKYCTEFKTVKQCCQEEGITPAVYYRICKDLGKRSVNTPINKSTTTKNNKKVHSYNKKQHGGTEIEQKSNTNVTKMDENVTNNDKNITSKQSSGRNIVEEVHREAEELRKKIDRRAKDQMKRLEGGFH